MSEAKRSRRVRGTIRASATTPREVLETLMSSSGDVLPRILLLGSIQAIVEIVRTRSLFLHFNRARPGLRQHENFHHRAHSSTGGLQARE